MGEPNEKDIEAKIYNLKETVLEAKKRETELQLRSEVQANVIDALQFKVQQLIYLFSLAKTRIEEYAKWYVDKHHPVWSVRISLGWHMLIRYCHDMVEDKGKHQVNHVMLKIILDQLGLSEAPPYYSPQLVNLARQGVNVHEIVALDRYYNVPTFRYHDPSAKVEGLELYRKPTLTKKKRVFYCNLWWRMLAKSYRKLLAVSNREAAQFKFDLKCSQEKMKTLEKEKLTLGNETSGFGIQSLDGSKDVKIKEMTEELEDCRTRLREAHKQCYTLEQEVIDGINVKKECLALKIEMRKFKDNSAIELQELQTSYDVAKQQFNADLTEKTLIIKSLKEENEQAKDHFMEEMIKYKNHAALDIQDLELSYKQKIFELEQFKGNLAIELQELQTSYDVAKQQFNVDLTEKTLNIKSLKEENDQAKDHFMGEMIKHKNHAALDIQDLELSYKQKIFELEQTTATNFLQMELQIRNLKLLVENQTQQINCLQTNNNSLQDSEKKAISEKEFTILMTKAFKNEKQATIDKLSLERTELQQQLININAEIINLRAERVEYDDNLSKLKYKTEVQSREFYLLQDRFTKCISKEQFDEVLSHLFQTQLKVEELEEVIRQLKLEKKKMKAMAEVRDRKYRDDYDDLVETSKSWLKDISLDQRDFMEDCRKRTQEEIKAIVEQSKLTKDYLVAIKKNEVIKDILQELTRDSRGDPIAKPREMVKEIFISQIQPILENEKLKTHNFANEVEKLKQDIYLSSLEIENVKAGYIKAKDMTKVRIGLPGDESYKKRANETFGLRWKGSSLSSKGFTVKRQSLANPITEDQHMLQEATEPHSGFKKFLCVSSFGQMVEGDVYIRNGHEFKITDQFNPSIRVSYSSQSTEEWEIQKFYNNLWYKTDCVKSSKVAWGK
jgi:hypothetical protein